MTLRPLELKNLTGCLQVELSLDLRLDLIMLIYDLRAKVCVSDYETISDM